MKYEIYAATLLLIGAIIATLLSINKSKGTKYIIWGITTIAIFAPVLSWLVGRLYGISEGSGFAAIAVQIVMLPILFAVGGVLCWLGEKQN